MLRFQERGRRLDAEQRAGTHENWKMGVRRGRKQDVREKGRERGQEEEEEEEEGGRKEWKDSGGRCGEKMDRCMKNGLN